MPAPGHNTKVVSWQKRSKVKAKVVKKRQGVQEKYKQSVKLVSGTRTGKAKRKAAHKQKLAEKEKAALEIALQDVEMQDSKAAKKGAKQQQQQGTAAGAASEAMQE